MLPSRQFRDKFRYKFDNFMAKGGRSIFISLVGLFVLCFLAIAALRGTLYMIYPDGAQTVDDMFGHLFQIFLHLTDPGTMVTDVPHSPWYKLVAIIAGLSGVVIFSMLIAFITTTLEQKLAYLRKGHSKVIEKNHTLILGWNDRLIEILRELVLANESEADAAVVVLAERDKEEMDDFIEMHLADPMSTRVVTRSGNISSLLNLRRVAVEHCSSVIILASCAPNASDDMQATSDAKVVKAVLAVVAAQREGEKVHIVAEIFSERYRRIVSSISTNVTTVETEIILAKILVQTSRSVGLSVVYTELLSFDGCEMYFYNDDWGEIEFGELLFHFPDGVPIGIRRPNGELQIRPSADTTVTSFDDILIVAEDDSTIEFRARRVAEPVDHPLAGGRIEPKVERNLILGWSPKISTIVREYEEYVLEDSTVVVMVREPSAAIRNQIYSLESTLEKMNLFMVEEDPMQIEALLKIKPFSFDNIIILSQDPRATDQQKIDSETIILLLMIRDIFREHPEQTRHIKLITEVMDTENQELIARAGVNDFIISNAFVSMIFAQVSQERDMKRVYDDLFDEDGSEIYLKPASLYFENLPLEVTFADMMAIALKRDEICFGVKVKALERNISENFGVELIPEKTKRFLLKPEDTLVVFAEDDT